MKVLVTGATGFIGGHVVRSLLAAGHEVRALVRTPAKAAGLAASGVDRSQGDLLDIDSLEAAVSGCDAVIHTAAQTGKAASRADHQRVSGEGTRLIAEAAARAGLGRFVHVSSMAVYRTFHADAREDDPKGPWNAYGAGKWAAEQALLQTAAKTGMQAVILRPPMVYGDGGRQTDWTRQIGYVLSRAAVLPLPLRGDFPLSWVHVTTLAEACLSALTADVAGEALNVHDGHDCSLADLISLHREITGKAPMLLPVPWRMLDVTTLAPALWLGKAPLGEAVRAGATFNPEGGITLNLEKARRLLPYRSEHSFLATYRQVHQARQAAPAMAGV